MSNEKAHNVTKKQVMPELRFKEFDGGVIEYLFNDVFHFSTGKNIKQKEASPEFETPCVRYGELYHMYREVIYDVINKTNLDESELLFSRGDEILLPSAGEDPLDIGSASALTIKNVAIGRTINILRPIKENIYSQIFASYYINQKLRKKISTLAKGSSISNVYNSDLKTLKFNLPSLPEQIKIASFLSAVDEKIQQLIKKKALLEQYKKGVMQQLFSGQLRFKPDLSGVEENGNNYPDWKEKRLGDLCKTITGKLDANAMKDDGEYRFYTCAREYFRIDEFAFDTEALLVSGNGANVGYIHYYKGKFNAYQRTYVLDGFEQNIFYIKKYLEKNLHERIHIEKKDGNTPYITLSTLTEMKIEVPLLPEQQKIATYLSSIDTKTESVNQQITQTQTFKKGLLQQMFV
ncbi:MAG: restriction endonuclease subunit S [Fluviicola sp.]|nr:restriction endonuclease subunit S [Fluviicola sp.]